MVDIAGNHQCHRLLPIKMHIRILFQILRPPIVLRILVKLSTFFLHRLDLLGYFKLVFYFLLDGFFYLVFLES